MLGYAFMGKAHSNGFRKIGYMTWPPPLRPRLVSIAGRNETAVSEAAERYGFERWTTDWQELVADPAIGLLDNLGPNSLHAEPTILAAEAGKHVVCEKPLGRDADESYEIWRRVAATGVKHLCAFNYRFVPAVRLARELIDAGELGEIRHFRGRYLQDWGDTDAEVWRFDRAEAGSGALGDLAAHVVDLARYLVGEIDEVGGFLSTFIPDREVDDAVEATVRFANGAVGTLEATRLALGRRNAFQWEINGTKGSLAFDMERLNELQVFRAGDERTRGFTTVLRLGGEPSVLGALVAAGPHRRLGRHVRPRAAPLPRGDRRGHGCRAAWRDLRGRLPRGRGVRRDRALRARAGGREAVAYRMLDASRSIDLRSIRNRVPRQASTEQGGCSEEKSLARSTACRESPWPRRRRGRRDRRHGRRVPDGPRVRAHARHEDVDAVGAEGQAGAGEGIQGRGRSGADRERSGQRADAEDTG